MDSGQWTRPLLLFGSRAWGLLRQGSGFFLFLFFSSLFLGLTSKLGPIGSQ